MKMKKIMQEPNKILDKMFHLFDESDIALVLRQAAKRMVMIKQENPDIGFMYDTIMRFAKIIESGELNEEEKNHILNPSPDPKVSGRTQAILSLRRRTNMRFHAAVKIVDDWIQKNGITTTTIDKPNEINNVQDDIDMLNYQMLKGF
jgi:hypothetical protein